MNSMKLFFFLFVFIIHHSSFCISSDPPAASLPQAIRAGWPQAGGNAQRTGYTDDSPEPFEQILKTETGEEKYMYYPMVWAADFRPEDIRHAQPVVADGRLFIGTLQGNFYALAAENGERLWHFSTDPSGIGLPVCSHAAVDNGRVFFAGMNARLYALDPASGKEIWSAEMDAPVSAAPCAADGMIFIGDRGGGFSAIDAATGAVKWRRQLSFVIDSAAAYHEGKAFVLTEDSILYCLAAADGKELWTFKAPGGGFYRGQYPVVHNGRVMFRVSPMSGSHEYADLSWLFSWLEGDALEKANALGRAIHDAKLADYNAPLPEEVQAGIKALREWYEEKPFNQTFYALDEATGRQDYIAVHFHSCGYVTAGLMPPAVCANGKVVATVPWVGRNNFGLFDPARNELVDIRVEQGGTNPDEDHFASVGGDRIFIAHAHLGGCSAEGMWNPVDRSIASFMNEHWLVGHGTPLRRVSIMEPEWTPDTSMYNRVNWSNGGAMSISGNMFFRQERSMVFAWRGKD